MNNEPKFEMDHSEGAFFSDSISITHGGGKFILDFKQTTPRIDFVENEEIRTLVTKHNAVVMDARLVKVFMQMLKDSMKNYEKVAGKIDIPKPIKSKRKKKTEKESRYID